MIEILRANAEWVAAALAATGALCAALITMVVWLWKLSAWIKGMETDKRARDDADKTRDELLTQVRNGLIRLEIVVREREKGTDKLEGALMLTRDDLSKTNTLLGRVVDSLKKLWETVEKPVRISDRKP